MLFAFYKVFIRVFISELSHYRKMFTLDKKEKLGKILHDIFIGPVERKPAVAYLREVWPCG